MKNTPHKSKNVKEKTFVFENHLILRSYLRFLFILIFSLILLAGRNLIKELDPFQSWLVLLIVVSGTFWIGRAIIYRDDWKSSIPSLFCFAGLVSGNPNLFGYSTIIMTGIVILIGIDIMGWLSPLLEELNKMVKRFRGK